MTNNVHVGVQPNEWDDWESRLVHFHHFESMSTEKDRGVLSPKFSCCNHDWRMHIYPGGWKHSRDGMVSLFLENCSSTEISAAYTLLIRNVSGKVIKKMNSVTICKFTADGNGKNSRGRHSFVEREKIIDPSNKILNHGTLTVEVRIKPEDDHCCMNFIPKNALAQNILQTFMDETTSDMLFEVKGRYGTGSFHAHKLILQSCAKGSTLASLCENRDKSTPGPILNIDPQVFRQMLYYVYGGSIAAAEWKERSKDFIDAADRYGVKNFKIEAEAWYVNHLTITVDNVVDALVYAEEKNCFLLKEAAMNFILKNTKEVLASDTFDSIPESKTITREIFSLATMNNKQGDAKKDLDDPTKLSINELRGKLHDLGKEIYGPRKRLIEQLTGLKKNKPKTEYDESTDDEQAIA